jgi:transposase
VIQLTPQMRLLLAVEPVDFRKGIDGLVQVCRQRLNLDPIAGALFVFSNRRRRALKILMYDGQGFWLCQKRLSQGRFGWWPSGGQAAHLGFGCASTPVTDLERQPQPRPSRSDVAADCTGGLTERPGGSEKISTMPLRSIFDRLSWRSCRASLFTGAAGLAPRKLNLSGS